MVAVTAAVRSTGIGSWPGSDLASAAQIAFAECPDLPYLPELPARGAPAAMIGRTAALLADLSVDLQPAGWRLTDGPGRDHRAAIGALRSDLDGFEEVAQGYAGPVKLSFAGPWTMAATVERPRGDRVLADWSARRDLGQSLTEGLVQLLGDLRRRLPDVEWWLQLDEPLLPAVLAGAVPTASGFSRHRMVDLPELSEALSELANAVRAAGAGQVVAHCCAAEPPIDLLRRSGLDGAFLDLDQLGSPQWDLLGPALESGWLVGLGVLRTGSRLDADRLARRAMGPLTDLGSGPEQAGSLLLTPACGLASTPQGEAVAGLRHLRTAAGIVTERLGS